MNRISAQIEEIIDSFKKIKKLENITKEDLEKFYKTSEEIKPLIEIITQLKTNQNNQKALLSNKENKSSEYIYKTEIKRLEKELEPKQSLLKELEKNQNEDIKKVHEARDFIKRKSQLITADITIIRNTNPKPEVLMSIKDISEFIAEIDKIVESLERMLLNLQSEEYNSKEHHTSTTNIYKRIEESTETYKLIIQDEIKKIDDEIKKLEEMDALQRHIERHRIILRALDVGLAGVTVFIDTNQLVKLYEEFKKNTDNAPANLSTAEKLARYFNLDSWKGLNIQMPIAVKREDAGLARHGVIGTEFVDYLIRVLNVRVFELSDSDRQDYLTRSIINIWVKTEKGIEKIDKSEGQNVEEREKNAINYFLQTADFEICYYVLKNRIPAVILTADKDLIEILKKEINNRNIKYVEIKNMLVAA